jgi:hypothetical protein
MEILIDNYLDKIKVLENEINEMDLIIDGIRQGNKIVIINEREKLYNSFEKKIPSTYGYDKTRKKRIYEKYSIQCNEILSNFDNDLGITEDDLKNEKFQRYKFTIL